MPEVHEGTMRINPKSLKKATMDPINFVPLLISAILAISAYILGSNLTRIQRYVLIILVAISFVFSVINLQQQSIKDMESSTCGMISSSLKDISYPCMQFGTVGMKSGPDGFVPFLMGTGFGVFGSRGAAESNPTQPSEDRMIVWTENGRLKVSTVVRDKDGKILARMIGNDWFTMPRPAILDRNYNANSLEVMDVYGNIVLQVSMVGPCARILGVFYDKFGNALVIDDTGVQYTSSPYNIKIDPIFVHPCEGHLGERIKPI